jgi:HEAT repeat protein
VAAPAAPPLGIEELIEELTTEHNHDWSEAADGLARIGEPAVAPLANILDDHDGPVWGRRTAAWALGRFTCESAIPPLLRALNDPAPAVRHAASQSLSRIGPSTVDELLRIMVEQGEEQRVQAVRSLARMETESVVPPLMEALHDTSAAVRKVAAMALGERGFVESAPILVTLLDEGSWYEKSRAAGMLGELRYVGAVEPLIEATADSEWKVRIAARDALVAIGQPAVDALLRAASHEDASIRMKAVSALDQLRCPRAVGVYIRALRDEHWMVREEAALALSHLPAKLTEGHLVAALDEIDDQVRCTAAWVLGEIRAKGAIDELMILLSDPGARCAAAVALGKIGAVEAIPALERMAAADSAFANLTATWALEQLRS